MLCLQQVVSNKNDYFLDILLVKRKKQLNKRKDAMNERNMWVIYFNFSDKNQKENPKVADITIKKRWIVLLLCWKIIEII